MTATKCYLGGACVRALWIIFMYVFMYVHVCVKYILMLFMTPTFNTPPPTELGAHDFPPARLPDGLRAVLTEGIALNTTANLDREQRDKVYISIYYFFNFIVKMCVYVCVLCVCASPYPPHTHPKCLHYPTNYHATHTKQFHRTAALRCWGTRRRARCWWWPTSTGSTTTRYAFA